MKSLQYLKITLLVTAGIILLVNLLSDRFFVRWDITENKQFTLSKATKQILKELDQPVTIKAYFSENLPPRLVQVKKDFTNLLVEYSRRSGNMVLYEFLDPSENPELEQEAQQAGIPPMQVQVRNKDKFEAMVCYMGATIHMGESQPEVLPQVLQGMPLEYHLTSAIKKLSVTDKPRIAFLQGHGEPSLASLRQALADLSVLYFPEAVELFDTTDALAPYRTLAIIAPTDSFPDNHLQQLDRFLEQGKNIFIAMNRVDADLQNGFGSQLTTGLEGWLSSKGIHVEGTFVVDANCGQVSVVQNLGGMRIQRQIPFPYLPLVSNFNSDHPVTSGIEQAIFSFVSPMRFTADSAIKITPLAHTSNESGRQPAPTYLDPGRQWRDADFAASRQVIAAAIEGPIQGNVNSKMVVFADGDFAVNDESRGGQVNEDNVHLLTNSVDWLTDESGLIDLRTKQVTSRPLDEIEDGKKAFLKWFNFLLPIVLVLLIGLYRWQRQSFKRIRRMQPDYID
jgi:gliding-associated putative ABC transporter substrate-binding component GldG